MEKKKVSKKALRSLLNDAMRDAIGRLELPAPTKKVKKLVSKSSKLLATEFAHLLKKQNKKSKTVEKFDEVERALKGKKKSKKAKLRDVEPV